MMKGSSHRNNSGTPLVHADHSSGVSELIGGILMIVLVVAAVAIIGIFLFSQQPPQKVPNINFMTGTDTSGNLYLYHNGGDSLKKGEFAVVIDDQAPRTDYTISDGSNEWSVGRNLKLGVSGTPKSVAIIYNGTGSGEVVLRSASSSVAVLQNSINPSGTPVIPGGGSGGSPGAGYIFNDAANISNSSYFVDAISENVSANRIVFYKNSLDSNGGLKIGTGISLKVTDTQKKSIIIYDGNLLPLNNTDIISVNIKSQTQNFKSFGIAPQIWELAADKAELTITRTPPIPNIGPNTVDITHTWLDSYELVGSTLEIDTTGTSVTALTVNRTRYLPPPNTYGTVTITGVKPLPIGLFLLIIDDSQKTAYLVGTADQICMGTSPANCGPFGL